VDPLIQELYMRDGYHGVPDPETEPQIQLQLTGSTEIRTEGMSSMPLVFTTPN
jgi:hypothetical protein